MVSTPFIAICALLAVISAKTLVTVFQRARGPLSYLPGPWYTVYTSKVLLYYWIRGERTTYVERLHEKYGPVVRLSPSEIDFSSISGAKKIHRFRQPFLKASFYEAFQGHLNVSESVFSTRDSDFHALHRRLLSGPMSKSSLKSVEPIVKARVELAIQKMTAEVKSRGCVDVLKWWLFMATDIIGELSFGDSFRMLEIGKKNQYAEDLGKVASMAGIRLSFPALLKIASRLPFSIPLLKDSADSMTRILRYAEESLQRHKRIVEADPVNAKPTLFKNLYKAGEEGMSDREIASEARAYIVAGSDTTAHSLTYMVWAVCKDVTIRQRLVEEVSRLPEHFTDEDLESLPYMNNVIQETLRLYAAAPGALPRTVPSGGSDIDGYWLPGGLTVTTQAWSLHRDGSVFPDPYSFNPSRWENATKDMHDAWMPFGGGPRNCIGLNLAMMELRLATASFFRAFTNASVSSREGFTDNDMAPKAYLLVYPKGKRCLIDCS